MAGAGAATAAELAAEPVAASKIRLANTINANANLTFSPSTLTINSGEAVTFAFGSVAHNVGFDNPNAATPTDITGFNSNVSIQRTFNTAGTYIYHCNIHPTMTGTIVVR